MPFIIIVLASCNSNNEVSDAYGNFEADDFIISSESNGKLLFFDVEEGQQLEKGKPVGVVDTTDLILKRKQLLAQKNAISSNITNIEAQIEVQEQQKKNLLVDKNRIENMLKDAAATQKQLDDINGAIEVIDKQISSTKTKYASIRAEQEVVVAQMAQVEESIQKCKIINPINGTVLVKYAEPNEITAFGKPLYKIADMNELFLRVYVSGAQLPQIQLGQEVEVLIDENKKENRHLKGSVSWISESAEFTPKIIQTKEERVNMVYAIKVRVKNDGRLKIGMPGEVNFKMNQ
ncbi:MAG: HlyD family efflux transporter periplasmic adaptor subunit [Bacteroidales bacterium]|nr:HlyD family efflux transporter periplasmic adaptor subunit [Bacteroidales bacterium]